MKIAITGSSGFIGTALIGSLNSAGHEVVPVVRKPLQSPHVLWDPKNGEIESSKLEEFSPDIVIHLAGEGIGNKKWTPEQKQEILESRRKSTELISETVADLKVIPKLFVSASAIGYYGSKREEPVDETANPGEDFVANVCLAWENATQKAKEAGIKTAIIRTGIVLDKTGGTLAKMLLPFKLGAGGKIGSGKQFMSWISLDDEVKAIEYIINNELEGIFNLTAPNPVTNEQFTKSLGARLKRPTFLPTPLAPLKVIYGSELVEALLLGTQNVLPKALLDAGYKFEHETIDQAFKDVL